MTSKIKPMTARPGIFSGPLGSARLFLPMSLAFGGWQMANAQSQLDYRFEYYKEDDNRMTIETHSIHFEQQIIDSIMARGDLTYDGISGATPTGLVDPTGKPYMATLKDIRRAEGVELDAKLGNHTLTPAFTHSLESDYESYGVSLGDAVDFNDKNTTLKFGFSHNFDSALSSPTYYPPRVWKEKQSTEGIIGISQLLSPKAIFSTALTFGNDSGYLSDPYRFAAFEPFGPGAEFAAPDTRPSHRNKEVLYTSLTYFVVPAHASIEGSYRFYHDSYGILSHTLELSWHEWLGSHVIIEPRFRFSEQSAADFYTTGFPGPYVTDPNTGAYIPPSGIHSSDYRLSELYTLDYGLQATFVLDQNTRIIVGYHRYEMYGLDSSTPPAMYPKANVITIGFSLLW